MTTAHQLINQTSGKTEWYTPREYVNAARRVMGGIDLDPASSAKANRVVQAARYYGRPSSKIVGAINGLPLVKVKNRGGLIPTWYGRVWMNHPFGTPERACSDNCTKITCQKRGYHIDTDMPGNADWIDKLVISYERGSVDQACCIVFASVSEQWFQPLLNYPICFPNGRVNYIDPETDEPASGATKGSCIAYLGKNVAGFIEEFSPLGRVMLPAQVRR